MATNNDSIKPVKIAGELFWSKWMGEFNTKFQEDNTKYECCIGNLSDKAAAALEELGIIVKDKEGMGKHIVGKSQYLFNPIDSNGLPVSINDIGNGTKCFAVLSSYRHKMSAKFGAAPSIQKIVITELKKYTAPTDTPQDKEDDEYIL